MKKRLQFAVVFSVCFSLVFFGLMLSGNEHIVAGDSKLDVASWIPPQRSVSFEALSRQINGLDNPFKKKLYEELKLKGFMRSTNGHWAGVFLSPDGLSFSLTSGQTYKNITAISIEQGSCLIRSGKVIKTLELE